MLCPKDGRQTVADDCEECVSERRCFQWCLDHIVWGHTGEPLFTHPMGEYGEALGDLLTPKFEPPLKTNTKTSVPPELRWAVFERDNFTCQDCGSRQFLTIDHIIPESKGGATTKDNLQTLCKKCNACKGAGVDPQK